MSEREIERLGIVGAGAMGRGIAQLFAQSGLEVRLFDIEAGAVKAALESVSALWDRLVEKGRLSAAEAEAARARLLPADSLEQFKDCDLVVEAVVEKLEVKTALFAQLEGIVEPGAILASNTSSLSITAIAAACARPGRVAGLHFFNPVPLMKLVEIVAGERSAPETVAALEALVARAGHKGVRVGDTPGFLVNHAGRAYGTEALKLLQEGVAPPVVVDRVAREAGGFRMGPFELLDLTALDVSIPVMESIYQGFYEEPRLKPAEIGRRRLTAGLLGRKAGEGFYRYGEDGQKLLIEAPEPPKARLPANLAVAGEGWAADALRAWAKAQGLDLLSPSTAALILVAPLGEDVSSLCARLDLDAKRTLGMDAVFGLKSHRTLATNPATLPEKAAEALALARKDGTPASLIKDSPGLLLQRLVAGIVNLASEIAQLGIASPADIDAAVTLGLGYPKGPLAWGDALGPEKVLEILRGLAAATGDPRYRPSLWLRRRAELGLSLLTEEGA
ncbi:3-hydroxyacyl-CoA dehydrogenase [Limibacillus halophilus]